MYQNAAKHLTHVFRDSSSFEHDFSHVYNCKAECNWDVTFTKHDLSGNIWLKDLIKDRER